ncbi:MAG: M20/M25/M40 family metallo-hydrolase [Clostridia bacterium]
MKGICAHTHRDEFLFEGWRSTGKSCLTMCEPYRQALDAYIFLGSGSGAFAGNLRKLGLNHVWNMYGWDRYAVFDGEQIVAYLSGRPEGETLSQTLIEGNSALPHFIVGSRDNARLCKLLKEDVSVCVEGKASCETVANMRGCNILVPFGVDKPDKKRVLVVAHYDTMYNTAGGYDNQAGVAVVMALAKGLSEQKLDRNITFAFTDAEECRLAGARHLAGMIDAEALDYVLNIDGVGREDMLEVWCGPEAFEREIIRVMMKAMPLDKQCYRNPPPPGSDHAPFYERGVRCVMLTFNDQGIIHTPLDGLNDLVFENMKKMVPLAERILHAIVS